MSYEIREVVLENIRCFGRAKLVLSNPCVLVGKNDHGKSSVLKVLHFLMAELPPRKLLNAEPLSEQEFRVVDPAKDLGRRTRRVTLMVQVDHASTRRSLLGRRTDDKLVPLTMTFRRPRRVIQLSIGRPRRNLRGMSEEKAKHLARRLRTRTEFVFVPAIRDADTTVFREHVEALIRDSVRPILVPGQRGNPGRAYNKSKTAIEALRSLGPRLDRGIGQTLPKNMLARWSISFNFDLARDMDALADWTIAGFRMLGSTAGIPGGRGVPVGELGNGTQSSLLLAAMLAASKESTDTNRFIAMEEPELFLHPQAQRQAIDHLAGLASEGIQVLLTTHSPVLIDKIAFSSIAVVRDFKVFQYELAQDGDARRQEINTALANIPNGELYFADLTLLVEGEGDKLVLGNLLSRLARAAGCPELYGVSVIAVSGKTSFAPLVRLMSSYGGYGSPFKWSVLADFDALQKKDDGQRPLMRAMHDLGQGLEPASAQTVRTAADADCRNETEARDRATRVNELLRDKHFAVLPVDLEFALVTEASLRTAVSVIRDEGYTLNLRGLHRSDQLGRVRKFLGSRGISGQAPRDPGGKKPYLHGKIADATPLHLLSAELKMELLTVATACCGLGWRRRIARVLGVR